MVIFSVEIQEFLIGEFRDHCGIAAGLHAVWRIGEKRIEDRSAEDLIRRRKSALHLVIDDAVVPERIFRFLQLIMPALLAEDLFILIDIRIEDGVQIDIHQVLKIPVVAACHREDRLVRISHGVEKCVHGPLDEFDKRILQRKFARTAENRVLDDMRHAG